MSLPAKETRMMRQKWEAQALFEFEKAQGRMLFPGEDKKIYCTRKGYCPAAGVMLYEDQSPELFLEVKRQMERPTAKENPDPYGRNAERRAAAVEWKAFKQRHELWPEEKGFIGWLRRTFTGAEAVRLSVSGAGRRKGRGMSHYILDKAYKSEEPKRLDEYRVVVPGDRPGTCRLPGDRWSCVLGVTIHGADRFGTSVAVRKAGIARCVAVGPIEVGQPVKVTADGRVEQIDPEIVMKPDLRSLHEYPPRRCEFVRVVECLGFAETAATGPWDELEVFLQFHQRVV